MRQLGLVVAATFLSLGLNSSPAYADDMSFCNGDNAKLALPACNRLLQNDKLDAHDKAVALVGRAFAYQARRNYTKAIADYSTAIEIEPSSATLFYDRGNAYAYKGNSDAAIADYTKAIELRPDYAKAFNNRGHTYNARGNYDLAITDLNKAIELKSDYADPYFNRGNTYVAKGDLKRALADYNIVLALDPKNYRNVRAVVARIKKSQRQ